MIIGVLALQGGVREHISHIKALGHEALEVKMPQDLKEIDGIILPGGESTAIGKLLKERQLLEPLRAAILSGLPVWGTCAGMILLAKKIEGKDTTHIGVMDIEVRRNAYGCQLGSFKVNDVVKGISCETIPLVFIRAPYILYAGSNVEILHEVNGNIVAAKQNNMLVTAFHPELTDNLEFHRYFINNMIF